MSTITGMMLSDGHIALRSLSINARFMFTQSGKSEKREYFDHVLSLMKPFCSDGYVPYFKEWRRKGVMLTSISLTTMQLPCFTNLRHLWYLDDIKIVPLNIKELLTPIALSHWIMGDGSKQNEGLHLNVYAFSPSDVDLLISALTDRYGLHCTIHQTAVGLRIYLNKSSMNLLRPIIAKNVLPSMHYKIGIN